MRVNNGTYKDVKWIASSAISALVFGYSTSMYMKAQTNAAVNVRPKLATVGPIDALLTGHLVDWMFYNVPIVGEVASILVFFLIMLFITPQVIDV